MGYGKKIYDAAREELRSRRVFAEESAQRQLSQFLAKCPRAGEIRQEMASNAAKAARAVLSGGNARGELEKLKSTGLALQKEFSRLLSEHGLTKRDIEPRYSCELCKDTGFQDGKMCGCLKRLQRQMAYDRLSLSVPLSQCTFERFSLDYYQKDPAVLRQMEGILNTCKEYAKQFRKDSSSLLFWGGTGLGKTHLSLAIANEVLNKGFGVIYGSAQTFAAALEKERFRQEDEEESTQSQLLSCDLLILDDLGTEAATPYVCAALYHILNTRMMATLPTVISTNLDIKGLESRYGAPFASRISGYYGKFAFMGDDVRVQGLKTRTN